MLDSSERAIGAPRSLCGSSLTRKQSGVRQWLVRLRKTLMSDYTVVSSEGFVRTLWGDDILLGLVSVLDSFFSFVGIFICRTLILWSLMGFCVVWSAIVVVLLLRLVVLRPE